MAENITQQGNSKTIQVNENVEMHIEMAEVKATVKNTKELKMFSESRRNEFYTDFNTCYSILKGANTKFSLPFLCEENDFKNFIISESKLMCFFVLNFNNTLIIIIIIINVATVINVD